MLWLLGCAESGEAATAINGRRSEGGRVGGIYVYPCQKK